MKTLVLRSPYALTNPIAGTPVLPSYDPSLMASYDASSMDVSGSTLTKWRNKQGVWGTAADLVTVKPTQPITVDGGAAVFQGGGGETYMDSSVFPTPMPLGKATFLMRIRFGEVADTVNGTIFWSRSTGQFAFLRRVGESKKFLAGLGNGSAAQTTLAGIDREVWVDLALVVDGANSKVYINGTAETVNLGTAASSFPSLRLGANADGTTRLNGRISHFRVYSRALDATEIAEIRASM